MLAYGLMVAFRTVMMAVTFAAFVAVYLSRAFNRTGSTGDLARRPAG